MKERLKLIELFKPLWNKKDVDTDEQISDSTIFVGISVAMAIIIWSFILISITTHFLGFNFFKWERMAILVVFGLGVTFRLPNQIYALKLLQHLRNLKYGGGCPIKRSANSEFKNILKSLNHKPINRYALVPLIVVVLCSGVWQIFSDCQNPYWELTKLPTVLFGVLMAFDFFKSYNKLTQNIAEVEAKL